LNQKKQNSNKPHFVGYARRDNLTHSVQTVSYGSEAVTTGLYSWWCFWFAVWWLWRRWGRGQIWMCSADDWQTLSINDSAWAGCHKSSPYQTLPCVLQETEATLEPILLHAMSIEARTFRWHLFRTLSQ